MAMLEPKTSSEKAREIGERAMLARRQKDREGVDKAKRALGERGPVWWKGKDYNRYLAKNTPYAQWFRELGNDI